MTPQFIRERITQLRLKKDISEYKMSYDLGHSRGYINNISSGKTLPSMTEFLTICEYFEITPIEFFDAEQQNPAQLRKLMKDIRQLSPEDQALIHQLIQRILNNKQSDEV